MLRRPDSDRSKPPLSGYAGLVPVFPVILAPAFKNSALPRQAARRNLVKMGKPSLRRSGVAICNTPSLFAGASPPLLLAQRRACQGQWGLPQLLRVQGRVGRGPPRQCWSATALRSVLPGWAIRPSPTPTGSMRRTARWYCRAILPIRLSLSPLPKRRTCSCTNSCTSVASTACWRAPPMRRACASI
jgi:hypothetical protein